MRGWLKGEALGLGRIPPFQNARSTHARSTHARSTHARSTHARTHVHPSACARSPDLVCFAPAWHMEHEQQCNACIRIRTCLHCSTSRATRCSSAWWWMQATTMAYRIGQCRRVRPHDNSGRRRWEDLQRSPLGQALGQEHKMVEALEAWRPGGLPPKTIGLTLCLQGNSRFAQEGINVCTAAPCRAAATACHRRTAPRRRSTQHCRPHAYAHIHIQSCSHMGSSSKSLKFTVKQS